MSWSVLGDVLGATAGAALALVLLLWLISIPLRDISIIDMAFSGLVAILLLLAWRVAGAQGIRPPVRRPQTGD